MVGNAAPGIKNDAESVEQPASHEPRHSARRDGAEEGLYRDDHQPAEGDIHKGGQDAEALREEYFEYDAAERQAPSEPKERPAPAPSQGDERERRVAPGNEQINARVIEYAEDVFDLRMPNAVVQGRHEVEQDKCRPKDRNGDDEIGVAVLYRIEHHQHQRGYAEYNANRVRADVGIFLTARIAAGQLLGHSIAILNERSVIASSTSDAGIRFRQPSRASLDIDSGPRFAHPRNQLSPVHDPPYTRT